MKSYFKGLTLAGMIVCFSTPSHAMSSTTATSSTFSIWSTIAKVACIAIPCAFSGYYLYKQHKNIKTIKNRFRDAHNPTPEFINHNLGLLADTNTKAQLFSLPAIFTISSLIAKKHSILATTLMQIPSSMIKSHIESTTRDCLITAISNQRRIIVGNRPETAESGIQTDPIVFVLGSKQRS